MEMRGGEAMVGAQLWMWLVVSEGRRDRAVAARNGWKDAVGG